GCNDALFTKFTNKVNRAWTFRCQSYFTNEVWGCLLPFQTFIPIRIPDPFFVMCTAGTVFRRGEGSFDMNTDDRISNQLIFFASLRNHLNSTKHFRSCPRYHGWTKFCHSPFMEHVYHIPDRL